jgi:tRNA threonylcarbamoyladenosine biosynthesis protein TsaB
MWTLALETTSSHGSLALLKDEQPHIVRPLEARAYAVSLFQTTEAVLAEAGLPLRQIDLFAVADGPGSFTGVRIGLTAVKGWIEALDRPAVAISTLRAVAAGGAGAPALAVFDASRGEVYFGAYPRGAADLDEAGVVEGLEPLEAFQSRRRQAGRAWRAFTPDAELAARLPEVEQAPAVLAPAVGRLGLAAWRAGHTQDALRLDARYIRRPDATLPAAAALVP